jgi:hypothetical protein
MVMHLGTQRGYSLLMAGLVGLVLAPFPQSAASASCVGPSLQGADALVLDRGGAASVEGRFFVDGCRDTMSCTGAPGCQRCKYDEPPEEPQQDISLELRQRGHAWVVGTADAGTAEDDRFGEVTWTFDVPRGVEPGRARLVAEGAQPVEVVVG